jgi:hypothetical protein
MEREMDLQELEVIARGLGLRIWKNPVWPFYTVASAADGEDFSATVGYELPQLRRELARRVRELAEEIERTDKASDELYRKGRRVCGLEPLNIAPNIQIEELRALADRIEWAVPPCQLEDDEITCHDTLLAIAKLINAGLQTQKIKFCACGKKRGGE